MCSEAAQIFWVPTLLPPQTTVTQVHERRHATVDCVLRHAVNAWLPVDLKHSRSQAVCQTDGADVGMAVTCAVSHMRKADFVMLQL